mmetsp:Transcript_26921/g.80712  ORF Transcript_26921/g.80712 Transcript_26921/m.80712 type:complete len:242 (-) Transcript_26921:169-894(-)
MTVSRYRRPRLASSPSSALRKKARPAEDTNLPSDGASRPSVATFAWSPSTACNNVPPVRGAPTIMSSRGSAVSSSSSVFLARASSRRTASAASSPATSASSAASTSACAARRRRAASTPGKASMSASAAESDRSAPPFCTFSAAEARRRSAFAATRDSQAKSWWPVACAWRNDACLRAAPCAGGRSSSAKRASTSSWKPSRPSASPKADSSRSMPTTSPVLLVAVARRASRRSPSGRGSRA